MYTWQEPLSNDVQLLAEDPVAAAEEFVKLVVGVSEVVKAVLPQTHVLKRAKGLIKALNPVGAVKQTTQKMFSFMLRWLGKIAG